MSRPLNLLLVEDTDEDALLVLRELKKAGFLVQCTRVQNRQDMQTALNSQELALDLVISDYCLPNFSAPEALATLKESQRDLPFLIVSGTMGEETAVAALRAGAHDFLVKGQYSRLVPAIDRELREAQERQARRAAEQDASNRERRFRSLIENAQDIITVLSPDSVITYASPAILRVLGYTSEELLHSSIWELVHPDDHLTLQQMVAAVLEKPGNVRQMEVRVRHQDGGYRVLESVGKNLIEDPLVRGIVVNSRDISERKQAEEQLRQTNLRLEKALDDLRQTQQQVVQQERLRALGEMASGVAHDFNNALSSVLGFSEAMLMYPEVLQDTEQTLEFLRMIHTAAKDGANVVTRLSEFYRQRDADEALVPVDLNRLLEGTIALTAPRWKAQAQSQGIQIEVVTELGDVPEIPLAEAEIRQALTNLIFNAVDAMPNGGQIGLSTRSDQDRVYLRLTDQGTGMSEETLRRCLEPFFTTKGQKGTGLGLAMVYGVICRHGGHIQIESRLGQGTTFHIELPVVQSDQPASSQDRGAVGQDIPHQKVLLVEPDALVAKVLADFLTVDRHLVQLSASGQAALQLLSSEKFDVLVLDKALPEVGSSRLVEAALQAQPNIGVILLTGFGDSAEDANPPLGVDVVVRKPFSLSGFRQALIQAVRKDG